MAWDVVTHNKQIWGYPISLEAVSLIYNKKLVTGKLPTQLSDISAFSKELKEKNPKGIAIMWDYNTPYFSWPLLASAGASFLKVPKKAPNELGGPRRLNVNLIVLASQRLRHHLSLTPRSCSRRTSASSRQTSAPWPSPTPIRPWPLMSPPWRPIRSSRGDSSSPVLSTTLSSDSRAVVLMFSLNANAASHIERESRMLAYSVQGEIRQRCSG
jgi:hypothetical protein